MTHILKITAFLLTLGLVSCTSRQGMRDYEYRADTLLAKMTIYEKIGQLNQRDLAWGAEDVPQLIKDGGVGSVLNCSPEQANRYQRIAVERSRLGIPLLMARDVIHGYKTIMPIPLAQACSFNDSLVEEAASVAAAEAASAGIKYVFAPMIDVTHDPRWGRIAESLGEDALLTSRLGVAMIKGFQGEDMSAKDKVAACAKHFAAYGLTEGGRDYNSAFVSEQRLRDWILPPFEAAAEAGVATFMAGFNELNGIPVSGNKFLLRDVLRGEWDYEGAVISDYYSVDQLWVQGYAETKAEAARKALEAGVDIDMMGNGYINYIDSLIKAGAIDVKLVNEACRRVLELKFKLGLFENPYVDLKARDSVLYDPRHLEVAQELAAQSIVLVKNKNNVLPLDKEAAKKDDKPAKKNSAKSARKPGKIAVIGPLADAPYEQLGTWCFDAEPSHSVTPLAALRKMYGSRIVYAPGLRYSRDRSDDGFDAAVKAARGADVVLYFAGEESILSGEAKCRADISLPGAQTELLDKLAATGTPVVTIVMAGRPLTLQHELEKSAAMLIALHGGTMAGPALADVISGRRGPEGRLPVTYPRMVGQIPIYYNDYRTGRPADYRPTLIDEIPVGAKQSSLGYCSYWLDAGTEPLFPFGYGLSYSKLEYGKPELSSTEIAMADTLTVSCAISNKGKREAVAVPQLYVRDMVGSVVRPLRELKGYQKITLAPGETKTVSFALSADDLKFCGEDGVMITEPGDFTLWISPSSDEGEGVKFSLR